MKQMTVDVLDTAVNAWVVQTPGRSFPGVLIQGDSLKALYDGVRELESLLPRDDDARALVEELELVIATWLRAYEKAMTDHGRQLPYPDMV